MDTYQATPELRWLVISKYGSVKALQQKWVYYEPLDGCEVKEHVEWRDVPYVEKTQAKST